MKEEKKNVSMYMLPSVKNKLVEMAHDEKSSVCAVIERLIEQDKILKGDIKWAILHRK